MDNVVRILVVEDLPSDADLAKREITAALSSCVFEVVETQKDYLAAIERFQPDLIVSDFKLPHFDGLTAMKLAQQEAPMVPFIILTGSMNEETAVECMKAGAADYVIKEHIKRLGLAVVSALDRKTPTPEKERAETVEHAALNALQESEERYRSFFDNSIDAVLLTSPDGGILKANSEACRIFGYTEEELCQVGRNGVVDPSDPRLSEVLLERNRTGKFRGELTFIRKDGKKFPGEISTAVFKNRDGAIRTSMIIQDITERKQAEEVIKRSESKYRKLHESIRDGFAFVGMDGMIKEFNESYRQMIGYTPEELLMLTYRDITPEKWHAFEQNIVEQQVLARGYSEVYEKEYLKRDGTIFPVELRTFLIKDETGGKIGMWAIVRDITERKRAEEALGNSEKRFRDIAEYALEWIWEVNAEGKYTYASQIVEKILGYSPEEILQKHFYDLFHPDDKESLKKAGFAAFDMKQPFREFINRNVHKRRAGSGFRQTESPCSTTKEACSDTGGRIPTSPSASGRRRRVLLEDQLRHSQKMEAIGKLAGGIAHDFNNLLTVIRVTAQLRSSGSQGRDPLGGNIEEIQEAATRAADLTRSFWPSAGADRGDEGSGS